MCVTSPHTHVNQIVYPNATKQLNKELHYIFNYNTYTQKSFLDIKT
jgi:hypothetical protein